MIRGGKPPRPCAAPGCRRALPPGRRRFCCDLCRQRGQRAERTVETAEFGQAAVRMIRTMARRVGGSDIDEFGAIWEVMREGERAAVAAIDGLRAVGYSWAQIGAQVGASKQALSQWRNRRDRASGVNDSFTPDGGPAS